MVRTRRLQNQYKFPRTLTNPVLSKLRSQRRTKFILWKSDKLRKLRKQRCNREAQHNCGNFEVKKSMQLLGVAQLWLTKYTSRQAQSFSGHHWQPYHSQSCPSSTRGWSCFQYMEPVNMVSDNDNSHALTCMLVASFELQGHTLCHTMPHVMCVRVRSACVKCAIYQRITGFPTSGQSRYICAQGQCNHPLRLCGNARMRSVKYFRDITVGGLRPLTPHAAIVGRRGAKWQQTNHNH